jgi:hypothetical protein
MEPKVDDGVIKMEGGPSSTRSLDQATIDAVREAVDGAKARGWDQTNLKRWFATHGLELQDYKAAIAGQPLPHDVAAKFVPISFDGLPDRPHAPNTQAIRRHIDWLTEPARGDYDDALFEIAWDGDGRGPSNARLFDLTEIDAAVAFAAARNSEGRNLYIGAALRLPDTARTGRASGADFYVATAVPIDIDHDYDATRARMAEVCDDGLVVTTGLTPQRRSQHWTRLLEPCDDEADFGHAFAALVLNAGADMKVKDSARIMRLGGTVSYPDARKQALGYCSELTAVSVRVDARPSAIERLKALAPTEAVVRSDRTTDRAAGAANEIERDWTGRVTDGREAFFRDLLLKHLRHYQLENGADPSPAELFEAAFAEFNDGRSVDNRDERWTCEAGKRDLLGRAQNTMRRLTTGRLAKVGLYSIETGVGREEAEQVQANREAGRQQIASPTTMAEYRASVSQEAANDVSEVAAPRAFSATPYKWIDAARIPPRDVLYGRHYFRQFLSATVSPGGLGKSSNAVVEALAMVTGRSLLGEAPARTLRAWYWNGEDPMEELQRRIAGACIHYGITADDLGDRLFVDSGRDSEIVIAREDRNGLVVAFPLVEALIAEVKERQIDILIIDPFVASHAVSENDNTKIEAVVRQWMRVAEEGGCAIELVHHVRKGNGQNETTVEDARGAGALLAKVRSARVLNGMTKAEAQEIGIDDKERFSFFRIDNGKSNLTPRGDGAVWRRMVGVPLGNRVDAMEDNVGVPTAWERPDAFAGVKDHHRQAVVAAVRSGEWRDDIRAGNWVGHAVAGAMGLDMDEPKDKARAKQLVRMWTKTGVLQVIQGTDAHRKIRAFVIAPEPEE